MQVKAMREARIDEETAIVAVKLSPVYAGDGTGLHQRQQRVEGDRQSAGSPWLLECDTDVQLPGGFQEPGDHYVLYN